MFEVVYYTSTGNTREVAEVMAETLGVTAKDIGEAGRVAPDDFIFLGIDGDLAILPEEVVDFMEENRFCRPDGGRKIALFTTSVFNFTIERKELEKQLSAHGAVIVRSFKCLGRFLDFNKDHPSWLELKKAAWFARSASITLFGKRPDAVEALTLAV
jgi:flavodoxin